MEVEVSACLSCLHVSTCFFSGSLNPWSTKCRKSEQKSTVSGNAYDTRTHVYRTLLYSIPHTAYSVPGIVVDMPSHACIIFHIYTKCPKSNNGSSSWCIYAPWPLGHADSATHELLLSRYYFPGTILFDMNLVSYIRSYSSSGSSASEASYSIVLLLYSSAGLLYAVCIHKVILRSCSERMIACRCNV